MALESCVKTDWALKSSGKGTSSLVSLPCVCLCPVHSLHKDVWGCPNIPVQMEGLSSSPLHPLLPPSTLSPGGEAFTRGCHCPLLLATPQGRVVQTGQMDTELPVAPEMVSEHQTLPVCNCLQPFVLPSLQEPSLTHKGLPRPTTAKRVTSAGFYAFSGLSDLLIPFCRCLSRNNQFSCLL